MCIRDRTITDSWEFLLMESARKRDEYAHEQSERSAEETSAIAELSSTTVNREFPPPASARPDPHQRSQNGEEKPCRPRIDEMLVCSAQGDVLYEWQSNNTNARVGFL